MTLARRLSAVESSLTPTQLVLRWLSEAHAHGSFEACAVALLDEEPRNLPLSRLCREAERSAWATVGSRAREDLNEAIAKAQRETVFRFLLVLRINVVAHEQLREEQLLHALYAAHVALLASARGGKRSEEDHRSWLAMIVGKMLGRVGELEAAARARGLAEERYLEGYRALFPNALAAWDAQLQSTKESVAMAVALADFDDVELPDQDEDWLEERVAVLLSDLVEPAKATALEKLGEGERGLGIATEWLRAKAAASSPSD